MCLPQNVYDVVLTIVVGKWKGMGVSGLPATAPVVALFLRIWLEL